MRYVHSKRTSSILYRRPSGLFWLRKGPLSGEQKLEKVDSSQFAGMQDAQQNQVFLQAVLLEMSIELSPKLREGLDGVFSVVVIPRYVVIL